MNAFANVGAAPLRTSFANNDSSRRTACSVGPGSPGWCRPTSCAALIPVNNVVWDLKDPSGASAAPGVYLVVLRDGDRVRVLKAAVTR